MVKYEIKKARIELCISVLEIVKESINKSDNDVLNELIKSNLSTSEHEKGVKKLCSDVLKESISYLNEFKAVL